MRDEISIQPGEAEALQALAESSDPMTRVIYHMSNRVLAMGERMVDMQGVIIRQEGALRRLVETLEKRFTNGNGSGSRPDLKAVVYGEK